MSFMFVRRVSFFYRDTYTFFVIVFFLTLTFSSKSRNCVTWLIIFVYGTEVGNQQLLYHLSFPASPKHVDSSDLVVRKDVSRLTREEIYELREAFHRFKSDTSVDGFNAIAEYHGVPPRCPRPDAKDRSVCHRVLFLNIFPYFPEQKCPLTVYIL